MALPTTECFLGLDLRDQISFIYEALYNATGSAVLPTPECFKGEDQRQQITDIYGALVDLGADIEAIGDNTVQLKSTDGSSQFFNGEDALEEAKFESVAGDDVYVGPGDFTIEESLPKTFVDWFFFPNSRVASSVANIWDDGGNAMTFRVAGYGEFSQTFAGSLVNCSNANSNIAIDAVSLELTTATIQKNAIKCSAGTLLVNSGLVKTSGSSGGWTIAWSGGNMKVYADLINSDSIAFLTNPSAAVGSALVDVDNVTAGFAAFTFGSDAAAVAEFLCRRTAADIRATGAETLNAFVGLGTGTLACVAGTLRLLSGSRIDTSANNAVDTLTRSGGTPIVDPGCILKSHTSRNTIAGSGAVIVNPYSCGNRPVTGVTVSPAGGFVVDANVV
jgi:hypothetical protein